MVRGHPRSDNLKIAERRFICTYIAFIMSWIIYGGSINMLLSDKYCTFSVCIIYSYSLRSIITDNWRHFGLQPIVGQARCIDYISMVWMHGTATWSRVTQIRVIWVGNTFIFQRLQFHTYWTNFLVMSHPYSGYLNNTSMMINMRSMSQDMCNTNLNCLRNIPSLHLWQNPEV